MKPRKNFDSVVFNSYTVLSDYPDESSKERKVLCQCKCGIVKPVVLAKLKAGTTKSCGTCENSPNYKHGMTGTAFYHVWENMIARCRDMENKHYGARGIGVCEEWGDFRNFYNDMFPSYDSSLTLERLDVNKGYYSENCVWDTHETQGHNRRKYRGNSKYYGVHWAEKDKSFIAGIVKGKKLCRIYFKDELDAAEGYDNASEILYGDRPNNTVQTKDNVLQRVIARLTTTGLIEKDYD